jgi:hypothetical protein
MSHHHETPKDTSSKPSLVAPFFLVAIVAGLFIAIVNFVSAMSEHEGGHETTEHVVAPEHAAADTTHTATEDPTATHH